MMRRRRKGPIAAAKAKARQAWAFKVKERAGGTCERCGTPNSLQAHHVIPSTWERYRFQLRNGVCLCYRHHIHWAHKDAAEFTSWLYALRPDDVDYFKQERQLLAQSRTLADYQELIAELAPESDGMADAA